MILINFKQELVKFTNSRECKIKFVVVMTLALSRIQV